MKRLIACMLVVVSLCTLTMIPGFAAETALGENEIMPCYAYTESVAASLKISKSGIATAKAELAGYPGTTTGVHIFMHLERKESDKWVTVDSWSESVSSHSLTIEESVDVESGYTYRVHASCYVYSGTASEYVMKYSREVAY